MQIPIPYNRDWLFELPLIDPATEERRSTAPAIAQGDVLIRTHHGSVNNPARVATSQPTAKILGFDSMSTFPSQGDVLNENGGDGVATVMFCILMGGDVGAGTAFGFMFVKDVAGSWTDNSTIDISGGATDIATVDGTEASGTWTLSGSQLANTAGVFAFANNRAYVALTNLETQCFGGGIDITDVAGSAWRSTGIDFRTTGDPDAEYQPEGNHIVMRDGTVGAAGINGSVNSQTSIHLPGFGGATGHGVHHMIGVYDGNIGRWEYPWIEAYENGSGEEQASLVPALSFTPQAGDRYSVLALRRDVQPASLSDTAKADVTDASQAPAVLTGTQDELAAVPAANASPLDKLAWVFAVLRNKVTNDGANQVVRNDADDAAIGTAPVSSAGGTVTRAKYS